MLTDVAGDTAKNAFLKKDPDAYLADHDLDENEKDAVKNTLASGDHRHLRKLLNDDESAGGNVTVNIIH